MTVPDEASQDSRNLVVREHIDEEKEPVIINDLQYKTKEIDIGLRR